MKSKELEGLNLGKSRQITSSGLFQSFTLCALLTLLISYSGVSILSSLFLCIMVVAQWLPGAIIWKYIVRNRSISRIEYLGMGLAIGTLLSAVFSQILRTSFLGHWSWVAPFIVSLPFVLISLYKNSIGNSNYIDHRQKSSSLFSLYLILLVGFMQLASWWKWHPLKWPGWWRYQIDVPYFESYSNSLALLGTTQSLMNPLQNSRYHWFSYAWVGSLNNSIQFEPFTVLTRLLPLVATIMAISVAWAWAASATITKWIPLLAAATLVAGPGMSIGSFIILRSPSSAMTVGWSLAFSFSLMEILKGNIKSVGGLGTLLLLASGVVGGKSSISPIVACAVLSLLVASFRWGKLIRMRIYYAGFFSLLTICLMFYILIYSSLGYTLQFGFFTGWPALVLTVVPTSVGLFWLFKYATSSFEPILVYSIAVVVSGLVLSLVTSDSGGNQIMFAVAAASIIVVPSFIGIDRLVRSINFGEQWAFISKHSITGNFIIIFCLLVPGTISFMVWVTFENSGTTSGRVLRGLAPLSLWVFAIISSLILRKIFQKNTQKFGNIKYFLTITLITSTFVGSILYSISAIAIGPIYSRSDTIIGYGASENERLGFINYDYFEAGKWVQKNTPSNAFFFTNRQCVEALSVNSNCDSRWFVASAVTKRQFLIEGISYSSMPFSSPTSISGNQLLSIRFSESPSREDANLMWEKGVRWGWIDHAMPGGRSWLGFAEIVYANKYVSIIKLQNPGLSD